MNENIYTLMNKNHPVLDFLYSLDTHHVVKILERKDIEYAPPAILDSEGNITRAALDNWWMRRAIPASRAQIQRLMADLNIESTLALVEKNFGLSLSDRYWINDSKNPQHWDEINFFDNEFTEDLGLLTLGQNSSNNNPNLMSPNSTVGGDLNKKWTILNGTRMLVKSGSGFVNQEVYNEVIATRLHQRLLESSDYVTYTLYTENGRNYCVCPNMLHEDEELIPALHIIQNKKKPNSQNDYQFLVSCFEELGLKNTKTYLSKMLVCDFLIANFDRHYQNFGVIRNVETLEYTRFAPIFDSGNSLWCNQESLHWLTDFEYIAKPFGRNMSPAKQLKLLSSFEWFHPENLIGFTDEMKSILTQNTNIPPSRIEKIEKGVSLQVKSAIKHIESQVSQQKTYSSPEISNQNFAIETRHDNDFSVSQPASLNEETDDMRRASQELSRQDDLQPPLENDKGNPGYDEHTE